MQSDSNVTLWVKTLRGGLVESLSQVRAVALGGAANGQEQVLWNSGDPEEPVFWRSTAKFIQALSLFSSGAVDKFAFSDEELALACASHSGGDAHVAGVARLLERIGARVDDLFCAAHAPLGAAEARALLARGPEAREPTRLHNNCSGKHTGMLAACRARGWPIADYQRLHHPLQQEILRHLSEVSGVPPAQIQTAVDGCGAVVFRTPLSGLARAYHRLLTCTLPEPHREAGQRILAALRAAPEMVAGPGRICTNLIKTTGGRVIGKVGAEGVYGLGTAEGSGAGLAIKVVDGSSKVVEPVVCFLARQLGLITEDEFEALRTHWEMPLINHQGERVGEVVVHCLAK